MTSTPRPSRPLAKKHKDIVVGVKSAHYQKPDWQSVDQAIVAGKAAGIPVMVDFGYFLPERPYWQLVTERLRPGDISTHMFRGSVPYLDKDGKLYDYLKRARARGVRFDVGHGGGSFAMRNAVPAIQQGFYPDSISTDLHNGSMNAGMMDMPATMSKLLVMGMPLKDVVRASTWTPAQMIHHEELGHLSVGAIADIAVFNVMNGKFGYVDAYGARIEGQQRILCELTVSGGRRSVELERPRRGRLQEARAGLWVTSGHRYHRAATEMTKTKSRHPSLLRKAGSPTYSLQLARRCISHRTGLESQC